MREVQVLPSLAFVDLGVQPNVVVVAKDFGDLARRPAQTQQFLAARAVANSSAHMRQHRDCFNCLSFSYLVTVLRLGKL